MTIARRFLLASLALSLPLAPGCGSTAPADVTGDYTVNLTNGDNSCMLGNWAAGAMTTGVDIVITQSGSAATGTVKGVTGVFLGLALGSAMFQGTVTGTSVALTDHGTVPGSSGSCAWTTEASIAGTLSGDLLTGSVVYRYKTNGAADCGYRATCTSTQAFNGLRPPK